LERDDPAAYLEYAAKKAKAKAGAKKDKRDRNDPKCNTGNYQCRGKKGVACIPKSKGCRSDLSNVPPERKAYIDETIRKLRIGGKEPPDVRTSRKLDAPRVKITWEQYRKALELNVSGRDLSVGGVPRSKLEKIGINLYAKPGDYDHFRLVVASDPTGRTRQTAIQRTGIPTPIENELNNIINRAQDATTKKYEQLSALEQEFPDLNRRIDASQYPPRVVSDDPRAPEFESRLIALATQSISEDQEIANARSRLKKAISEDALSSIEGESRASAIRQVLLDRYSQRNLLYTGYSESQSRGDIGSDFERERLNTVIGEIEGVLTGLGQELPSLPGKRSEAVMNWSELAEPTKPE
jgi:hypothetical protein